MLYVLEQSKNSSLPNHYLVLFFHHKQERATDSDVEKMREGKGEPREKRAKGKGRGGGGEKGGKKEGREREKGIE